MFKFGDKKCVTCGAKIDCAMSWQKECHDCHMDAYRENIIAEIDSGERFEVAYEDEIFCPYCGRVYEFDCEPELYEEGDHDLTCDYCEKTFTCETDISYSYSTKRQEV